MFPSGFLGTRADLLLDLVVSSLVVLVPALAYSVKLVRTGRWNAHRNLQTGLTLLLTVILTVFEMNLKASGGIFEMTRESRFAGTWLLSSVVYVHVFFAITSALLWLPLVGVSLARFSSPPKPGAFSRAHRFWGWASLIDTLLTGLSAVVLYIVGFAL